MHEDNSDSSQTKENFYKEEFMKQLKLVDPVTLSTAKKSNEHSSSNRELDTQFMDFLNARARGID